jgi:signal transduction histidine kinase/ligand-binding sensor domain-containing protein
MVNTKRYFHIPATIGIGIALLSLVSCHNTSSTDNLPPQIKYAAPVTQPLTFGKSKKIDWKAIKSTHVKPIVKQLDINKLPVSPYEDLGFKPFTHEAEKRKIDFNELPERDLDIRNLPSKPLKFKSYNLPPPTLVAKTSMRLKDTILALFELDRALGFYGEKGPICLLEDHNGFLWIGTVKNIYRYDGENLLLYVPGIAGDYISDMHEDSKGRIWICLWDGGLQVFDPATGVLQKTNAALGLGTNHLEQIAVDKQQRIWVSGFSPGGVNIIDQKRQTVKWLNRAQGLSDTAIVDGMMLDNHSNMWIATLKGLNIIDLENNKIKYFDKQHGLKSDLTESLYQDKKGSIYIGMRHGYISILNAEKNMLQSISEPPAPPAASYGTDESGIIEDDKGKVWVATNDNGLQIINPKNNRILHLLANYTTGENYVKKIIKDRRGDIWIATQTGLYMVGSKKAIVENIGEIPTTTIAEDNAGMVWQGTDYKGVNIINRKNKTISVFNTKYGLGNDTMSNFKAIDGSLFIGSASGVDIIDSSKHSITHLGKAQGIYSKWISAFVIDRLGRVWLGGDKGIDIYDPGQGKLLHLGKEQGLSDLYISDMCADQSGRIWISTYSGGIDIVDQASGIIRYINNPSLKEPGQQELMPDNGGNVWIGNKSGLYLADLQNKKLTFLSTAQGLIDEKVNSVLKYNNRIYAGTTKGISMVTPPQATDTAKRWKVESIGLNKMQPGYLTNLITKDGLYWWGDAGVTVLDLSKKENFIPVPFIAAINIMDEPVYFGASPKSAGITWDKVEARHNLPVGLRLSHDRNYLRFNYGRLDLMNRDTAWYRYRLIGLDKNWSDQTASTSSKNYFNLPPGKYTFEVILNCPGNQWSKPAQVSFTIHPPWWKTWWAYILYAALLSGSIWSFSHYRSLQLIKDKRILEHTVQVRTEQVLQQKEEIESQRDNLEKAFTELKTTQTQLVQREKMASLGELTAGIAHEIQNPLNFVNNFSEVSKELMGELGEELDKGDTKEAKVISLDVIQNLEKIVHHGKRADAIVKGMLQHSQAGSGIKELTNINALADECMRLAYHGLRAKDKSFNADLVTHFDESLPEINVIPQDMVRVMLNLFNNAFYAVGQKQKTAGADYKPEVSVTTSSGNGQVIIKVKDNGVGIPDAIKEKIMQPFFTTKPTGEGTGLGLSLTYDMVVKGHSGKIDVNTKEGEFTIFTISLPADK